MTTRTIQPAAVKKSLQVRASRETAFRVFTDGIDRWWPKTHTVGETPLKQALIEPREGGRWYGVSEAGVEDLWGEVLAWEPPERVVLSWRINGQFKPDLSVHTEVEVRFTDLGGGLTGVEFEHRGLENLGEGGDQARAMMDGGWGLILAGFIAATEG
ncbi:SRPBCC family protein [Phenylobacterium sp.]|uniref:SRPBCC family protein n=1 Tax=Phenylobacterium sp. TaxID=1871053 RepID=UPI0025F774A7|nr:SRPBCC family protein [Phenylobacterium sp.]